MSRGADRLEASCCGALARPGACAVYRRRRPEHTPLYRTVQGHLETYVALTRDAQGEGVPAIWITPMRATWPAGATAGACSYGRFA